MYEWLEQEIAAVKTAKFFEVGVVPPAGATRDENWERVRRDRFPRDYGAFIHKFGGAQFFRDRSNCYMIGIFDKAENETIGGQSYWYIGWYDELGIYVMDLAGTRNDDSAVFERSGCGQLTRRADSFEEWLRLRWRSARARYSSSRWHKIVEGPEPFNREERDIIEARRKFRWRLIEIDDKCTMRFEVRNESNRRLACIGIRVHGKRRGVWLGVLLRVDHIWPGMTAVVEYDKFPPGMLERDEIEVFERDEPGPEDRDFYSEFEALPDTTNERGSGRKSG